MFSDKYQGSALYKSVSALFWVNSKGRINCHGLKHGQKWIPSKVPKSPGCIHSNAFWYYHQLSFKSSFHQTCHTVPSTQLHFSHVNCCYVSQAEVMLNVEILLRSLSMISQAMPNVKILLHSLSMISHSLAHVSTCCTFAESLAFFWYIGCCISPERGQILEWKRANTGPKRGQILKEGKYWTKRGQILKEGKYWKRENTGGVQIHYLKEGK